MNLTNFFLVSMFFITTNNIFQCFHSSQKRSNALESKRTQITQVREAKRARWRDDVYPQVLEIMRLPSDQCSYEEKLRRVSDLKRKFDALKEKDFLVSAQEPVICENSSSGRSNEEKLSVGSGLQRKNDQLEEEAYLVYAQELVRRRNSSSCSDNDFGNRYKRGAALQSEISASSSLSSFSVAGRQRMDADWSFSATTSQVMYSELTHDLCSDDSRKQYNLPCSSYLHR